MKEAGVTYASQGPGEVTPPTTTIPGVSAVEVRIPVVEIRDRESNRLITAIEILSPVNKRKPGIEPYREKRRQLHQSGVHLLEIDLIRRGERSLSHPYLPKSHYLVTLTRAGKGNTDVWAFQVQDPLPVLPVPLHPPDEDVRLNLEEALRMIYERSDYALSIDYRKTPPPPPFSETGQKWIDQVLSS